MINNVRWTDFTSQNDFVAGPKMNYRLGTNEVMADKEGNSKVTFDTFVAAILDEIENPSHNQQQVTVVNN